MNIEQEQMDLYFQYLDDVHSISDTDPMRQSKCEYIRNQWKIENGYLRKIAIKRMFYTNTTSIVAVFLCGIIVSLTYDYRFLIWPIVVTVFCIICAFTSTNDYDDHVKWEDAWRQSRNRDITIK